MQMPAEQMEEMMENMMPRMMDSCFSQMDGERREFMLRHCRGMLDEMEQKYEAWSLATLNFLQAQDIPFYTRDDRGNKVPGKDKEVVPR